MSKKEWVRPEINQMFTHIYLCPRYDEHEEPKIFKMPVEEFIHGFNKDEFTGLNTILAKDLETMRSILGVGLDYKLDIYE
tara:strand:- start:25 stop:264 length:240 start_codon:yes stop_codon:yes gene_type:complete